MCSVARSAMIDNHQPQYAPLWHRSFGDLSRSRVRPSARQVQGKTYAQFPTVEHFFGGFAVSHLLLTAFELDLSYAPSRSMLCAWLLWLTGSSGCRATLSQQCPALGSATHKPPQNLRGCLTLAAGFNVLVISCTCI
jgi:hypothetical protein